jgi:probable FeS assembly SUF system protein SufT
MTEHELSRDVQALQIPSGEPLMVKAGTPLRLVQALGGTLTLMSPHGMVRIDQRDADALGLTPEEMKQAPIPPGTLDEQVWHQLSTCYDPEIPANIVDLGLIYSCGVSPHPYGGQKVSVVMTLTAPGCGMGEILKRDVEQKLMALPGVTEAEVLLVFDPPWDSSRMSEAARLQLGFL